MKMTGGQIVVRYLEQEGVPYALGIPGHGILGFFDALRDSKIKYLQVKHEQAAVHIADGYFRIKGRPLCVFTSIGPGALNSAIGLRTAYVDSSAVFQVSGDTHVQMKGVGVLQEIERYQDSNFIRVMEPVTKRCWRVESPVQLARIMQRAFSQMLTGRKGPVCLALPMNVQAETAEVTLPQPNRPEARPEAAPEAVEKALAVLEKAERPVILAGGALFEEGGREALIALAERWKAPVITTMASKSVFPEDHPLCGFHTGSKGTPVGLHLTNSADVILALGTRFADETTCSYRYGKAFRFPDTKLVQVDLDAGELGKNYPCDVAIQGDAVRVIRQLLKGIGAAPDRTGYLSEIRDLKEKWQKTIEERRNVDTERITISQLIGVLNECLPEDVILSTSSGNTQAQLFQEFRFTGRQRHLTSGGFSTMGWAFPAAIGAKLAAPDRPVVALMGDGDFAMTMQELATVAQYDIPVVIVVADNSGWMAIKDLQYDVFGGEYAFGNDFEKDGRPWSPDYAAVARAHGIDAATVSTREEAGRAIAQAIEKGRPALIHVRVCRDYPLSGGEAYGWWDVPIPEYFEEKHGEYMKGLEEEQV